MILKSEKITLRPFSLNDLETLLLWSNDKYLRMLSAMHPFPVTIEHNRQWMSQLMNDTTNKNIYFAAETNETKEFFGYFNLRDINLIHKHAFLGIIIGNLKMRGLGYGKEMMILGLDYGFNMLGLMKIYLDVLESNETAIRLYSSLGFVQEGEFINHYYYNGKWHNVFRLAKFN
jgi:RimJ/RimL family protein N-acetyltransferase